jgi:hypothetical protein
MFIVKVLAVLFGGTYIKKNSRPIQSTTVSNAPKSRPVKKPVEAALSTKRHGHYGTIPYCPVDVIRNKEIEPRRLQIKNSKEYKTFIKIKERELGYYVSGCIWRADGSHVCVSCGGDMVMTPQGERCSHCGKFKVI